MAAARAPLWGWWCALWDRDGSNGSEAVVRGPGTPTWALVTGFGDDCDGSEAGARGPGTPMALRWRRWVLGTTAMGSEGGDAGFGSSSN
ncbi:hypothetical protein GUJ93_ZPchr0005g14452 [Zizania palustris]|uniref:Uncharacterized protein n=1 Tax=Zizania palustris TaxID=103762 RepID=A0A8J5W1Z2_ZIZPA|nr:hypothetical protein GUJ93_ZPchr0005g14452 [Zizania palustris]